MNENFWAKSNGLVVQSKLNIEKEERGEKMNLPLGSYPLSHRMTDRCRCASPKEITVSFPMEGGICQTGDVMIPSRGRDRVHKLLR